MESAGFEEGAAPAVVLGATGPHGDGGAPVPLRPWKEATEVQLGSSRLPAGSIYSSCAPKRRFGDDRRRIHRRRRAACGFRRSGCSGREARGGGGRTRARVALPRHFIGAGRSRAGHGRPAAAKRRTPAESCTERTASGPRWVPRAGSGSGWCGPGSGCGLRSNCGRRRS
jgi:hypothetical protein